MDILDLLSGQLDSEKLLKQLSGSTGANTDQVQKAIQLGLPALLQSMGRNASTEQGATALAKALDSHKDDKIDDVEDFIKSVNIEDGSKILGHVLGGNKQKVQRNLAKQTGLQDNQVTDIMSQLAPLVLGTLGKQKASKNVGSSGLEGMLTGILGSQMKNNNMMDAVTNLLDSDDDGSIVDDVGNMLGGFFNKR